MQPFPGVVVDFSLRKPFSSNIKPPSVIEPPVTIKFLKKKKNQNGTWSLRFPVLKAVYDNGRTI